MTRASIQDRTSEFHAILAHAQKRLGPSKVSAQRQSLQDDAQRRLAEASPAAAVTQGAGRRRSEFARRAAEIGRGITATTAKLQRLAEREFVPAGRVFSLVFLMASNELTKGMMQNI